MYDLYSEFNLEQHMKNFKNYLEVVIEQDGHVLYAVPSHTLFLENYGALMFDITIEKLRELCPQEYYFDYMTWLLEKTGCVSVWSCGYMKPSTMSTCQSKVLMNFVENGVMENCCLNSGKI